MRRLSALCLALFLAVVAVGCSYDYSGVPIVEAPPVDGGPGGVDAGSRFTCDPILQTCTAMLHCALISDATPELGARCVTAGTGAAFAGCDGPDDCAAGYYCRSTGGGSASCQSYCTDVAPSCADGRTCDTATVLVSIGTHTVHPCI